MFLFCSTDLFERTYKIIALSFHFISSHYSPAKRLTVYLALSGVTLPLHRHEAFHCQWSSLSPRHGPFYPRKGFGGSLCQF